MQTKRMRIIMVPAKEEHKSLGLWLNVQNNSLWFDEHGKVSPNYVPMHLYVVSDGKTKEGNWFVWASNGDVNNGWNIERVKYLVDTEVLNTNYKIQYKIEATTDISLVYRNSSLKYVDKELQDRADNIIRIHQIPHSFIETYIKSKNTIEDVNVELDLLYYNSDADMYAKVKNDELIDDDYVLRTNENNEIFIHLIKDEPKESIGVVLVDEEKLQLLKVLYEHESEDLIKNISLDKELKNKIDAVVKEHFIKKEYFK